MPITVRNSNGQAVSAYGERDLYDLVAEVCRYISPTRPETVSQRAFDRSRSAAGHPAAPGARAICMRLGAGGASMSWDLLRRKALDGELDHDRSHAQLRGQAMDAELDIRHVVFALRWAARVAELPSLSPDRYETVRRELLRRERRFDRGDHDRLLPALLPSKGQIERIVIDHDHDDDDDDELRRGVIVGERREAWDRALMLAELEPRSVLEPERNERRLRRQDGPVEQKRLPLREAIHHYLEANGEMPSQRLLTHFARRLHIAVEVKSRPWAEHLDEARAYRASLGLDSPPENPKAHGQGARKEVKVPEAGIPGAPRRIKRRGASVYSEDDCIAALRRFNEETPPSEPRTQKRYLEFSVEHETVPPRHFQRYGGFTHLMKKVRPSMGAGPR